MWFSVHASGRVLEGSMRVRDLEVSSHFSERFQTKTETDGRGYLPFVGVLLKGLGCKVWGMRPCLWI